MVELVDGEVMQAFQFAVDLTDAQRAAVNRQFGGRRFAYNWTVEAFKGDLDRCHASGESTEPLRTPTSTPTVDAGSVGLW